VDGLGHLVTIDAILAFATGRAAMRLDEFGLP
jgi:hypothetical protein